MLRERIRDERISPGLRFTFIESPYLLTGATPEQWLETSSLLGPQRNGRRFIAYTDWRLTWTYRPLRRLAGYRLGDLRVHLTVRAELPVLKSAARSATGELFQQWTNSLAALRQHEDGHRLIGVQAAYTLVDTLRRIPSQPDESALAEQARVAADGVIAHYRELDAQYDAKTELELLPRLSHAGKEDG